MAHSSWQSAYIEAISTCFQGTISTDVPLSQHTTLRIGGPASIWLIAESVEDVVTARDTALSLNVPFIVVGKGSNLLVSDEGFDGVVLVLGHHFNHWTAKGDTVSAGAGITLGRLINEAAQAGLSGLEFAAGIPGTLGGALAMNAGTHTEWIASVVKSVTVTDIHRPGAVIDVPSIDFEWGYRQSSLRDDKIVLGAQLMLSQGDPNEILEAINQSVDKRKLAQPLRLPNAGSVFRNPIDNYAGKLIEAVGLKGYQIGDAQYSDMHANFIVNKGSATAVDVKSLMALAQDRVRESYGIELQPEIRFIG